MWLSDRSINVDEKLGKELVSKYKEGKIIILPCKIQDLVDVLIDHNEVIALWVDKDPWGEDDSNRYYYKVWKGMAWNIPEHLKNSNVIKIFGCVPEEIFEADAINILIETK